MFLQFILHTVMIVVEKSLIYTETKSRMKLLVSLCFTIYHACMIVINNCK